MYPSGPRPSDWPHVFSVASLTTRACWAGVPSGVEVAAFSVLCTAALRWTI